MAYVFSLQYLKGHYKGLRVKATLCKVMKEAIPLASTVPCIQNLLDTVVDEFSEEIQGVS